MRQVKWLMLGLFIHLVYMVTCDWDLVVSTGGPGAAHEAEQFAWNDHVVIPVRITGGAASGKFRVPGKIFEVCSILTIL